MQIDVLVADASHFVYADEICEEILLSARERKTGIARRTPEYVTEKMLAGKAVIAIAEDGSFAGFSYIETWGGKQYVANSGLIVAHKFRGIGLAMRIKTRIFQLSRELFPDAKIFSTAYPALQEELKGALSQLGCNFVTDPSTADWLIDISATAREYNKVATGNINTYFAYVDATISITRTATGQRVYENIFTEKGGHTHNYHQAAREAYKYLTPKICKVVEEPVKQ